MVFKLHRPALKKMPVKKRTVLFVFILLAATALIPVRVLSITAVKKESVVFLRKMRAGQKIAYHNIHSVELSPVWEYFRISGNDNMILYETRFQSSNVGLPYAAFGQEKFICEPDGYRISNMHRVIPELLIWANNRYDNRLEIDNYSLRLCDLAGDTLLRIKADTWPAYKYVIFKIITLNSLRLQQAATGNAPSSGDSSQESAS
ncbi:MAG: DUF1850 domain-containing protein [Desulfobacteraceae bacterium]|nr:DUF1850 domain-containing protein [Desulfobacteraceae bacterium]